MRIDVYSIMRNEAIILPYFLRHYETFAWRIFVFEDQSTDGTREILCSNSRVIVLDVEQHGINEAYWTNNLWTQYEQRSRGLADYAICVDADEFVYHPDLVGLLKREKEGGAQVIHCEGYTMIANGLPTTSGQIYDEIDHGIPDRLSSKWAIFSPKIHYRFKKGRHGGPREISDGAVMKAHTGVKMLHYRYLGASYFESRDSRNVESFNNAEGTKRKYSPSMRHVQPDKSRDIPLEWYEKHKVEAVKVVP